MGPLIFGRGWCGYACWTAMILDLLPYKRPENTPIKKLSYIRYIMFIISFSFVGFLFLAKVENIEDIMFKSFIIGNLVYYLVGGDGLSNLKLGVLNFTITCYIINDFWC